MRTFATLLCAAFLACPIACPVGARQDEDAVSPEEAARLESEADAAREEAARLDAEAAEAAAEIEQLQYLLVDAARQRADSERAALNTETRLAELADEQAELRAQIADDREALAEVFVALARLERARPPAAFAHGDAALDAARAADLLAEAAPALDTRADQAIARIEALEALRVEIANETEALSSAEADLVTRRAEIEDLIAARSEQLDRLRTNSIARERDAELLASRAADLRELIAQLEARAGAYTPRVKPDRSASGPTPRLKPRGDEIGAAEPPFVPPTGRFADARGTLSLPVAGRVVTRFGEESEVGGGEGVVIRARRRAQVTSPFDARIEYAGAFRGYGRLLILSVGDGYHIVLAGLSEVYGVAGQTVLAGEPIGEMADQIRPAPDLYVEIRKEGRPIDPSPWWRRGA